MKTRETILNEHSLFLLSVCDSFQREISRVFQERGNFLAIEKLSQEIIKLGGVQDPEIIQKRQENYFLYQQQVSKLIDYRNIFVRLQHDIVNEMQKEREASHEQA